MEPKLPTTAVLEKTPHLIRDHQKNAASTRILKLVIYTIQTFMILSQQNKRDIETFKLHNTGIYKRFTITVVRDLKKVISK